MALGQDRLCASNLYILVVMPTRCVHLPDSLASRFDVAASVDGGCSRVLRQLIESYLAERGEVAAVEEEALRTRGRSEKLTIRLKPEELRALAAASKERGMPPTTWLTSIVRARLLQRPTLNEAEGHAFRSAHRELNRIGINLNQIARLMNVAAEGGVVLKADVDTINEARVEIRAITLGVRDAFWGNFSYWNGGG